MNTFEQFINGKMVLPDKTRDFSAIPWSVHPSFSGVELKHIIQGEDTHGQFSFHLVRIAPNKEIGLHAHKEQLETHEIICGNGECFCQQSKTNYFPGIITFFPKGATHKITAGPEGLYLFAKFFPALC